MEGQYFNFATNIEKNVYPIVALKEQTTNVINYKHETIALTYTFKAGCWQI